MDINLSAQLQYYLKLSGMSVNKLADETGISQSYLNDLMSGKKDNPGIQKMDLIVKAFGTSFQAFFTSEETKKETEVLVERIESLQPREKEVIMNMVDVLERK